MENAVDALIMVGQALIFIVALTVCMSSFTTVRVGIDKMVGETETVKLVHDSQGYINYMQSKDSKSERIVGAETVVSSMYRAIKENYVIYIKLKDYNNVHNRIIIQVASVTRGKTNSGDPVISDDDIIIKLTIGKNQEVNKILGEYGLYENIRDSTFDEYLGEYQDNNKEVNTEDRLVYRIITYVERQM